MGDPAEQPGHIDLCGAAHPPRRTHRQQRLRTAQATEEGTRTTSSSHWIWIPSLYYQSDDLESYLTCKFSVYKKKPVKIKEK